ncbi:MAG: hypothetical protein AB8E74_03535 [Prochlorococcus sp.]
MADLSGSESEAGQLPVPYRNPWLSLRHDLHAVSADLLLRLRLLWRRNRDGDLSIPAFWPRALAPLFWPLLLSLVLVLFGSLAWPMITRYMASAPPASSSPARALPSASQASSASSAQSSAQSSSSDQPVPIAPPAANPADRRVGQPTEIQAEDSAHSSTDIPGFLPSAPLPVSPLQADLQPQESQPLQVALQGDPLFSLFAEADLPKGLLAAVEPRPQQNRLLLRLAPSWWNLSLRRRHELASRWLNQAEDLGYDDLRLLDRGDCLLARQARVGEGMIFFEQEKG